MKTLSLKFLLGALLLSCLALASHAATLSTQTIANLTAAFQGESLAALRYERFAEQAQKEGYAQVALLFRAASKAETIHRDSHRSVLLAAGVTPEAPKPESLTSEPTAANLKAAIQGESYERDTMYPGFIEVARRENARDALRTLQFAIAAEKQHAALYQKALARLGSNPTENYYVCPVCGNTSPERPDAKCPVCRKPADAFFKI
jgi:rubrerythrin